MECTFKSLCYSLTYFVSYNICPELPYITSLFKLDRNDHCTLYKDSIFFMYAISKGSHESRLLFLQIDVHLTE